MKNTTELPEFFSGFEVVGTLKDSLEACRVPQNLNVADDPYIYVQNYTSPVATMTKGLARAFLINDEVTVKKTQEFTYSHLEPLRQRIQMYRELAFEEFVDTNGVHFYAVHNNIAVIWVYPYQIQTVGDKKQLVVSIGSFDNTTGESSSASMIYTNKYVEQIQPALVAVATAVLINSILEGLNLTVDTIALLFQKCGEAAGLSVFNFVVPELAAVAVGTVLGTAITIGLVALIALIKSLLSNDFYIHLQIFNFDENRDWQSVGSFFDNAKIAGNSGRYQDFFIPRKYNKAILPEFVQKQLRDNIVVSYAEIDFENEQKVLEGLGIALSMITVDAGFTIACDCPVIGATVIKETTPAVPNIEKYFKDKSWADGLKQTINVNGMPVGMTLNTHNDAENNIYIARVFIGEAVL